jgi:hypothetical protein
MYNYEFTRLYSTDDEFSSRWQALGNTRLFIHKDSYIWLNGRTITIPPEIGEYFFFNSYFWLQIRANGVHLGQRMDA